MANKIRRNDPCPCGSGNKYKLCCMNKPTRNMTGQAEIIKSSGFHFKPGSYGDIGHFMPSIACLKQTRPKEWNHHFVLVKPVKHHTKEIDACEESELDLRNAFQKKAATGSSMAVAEYLRAQGYVSVKDFNIVKK